MKKCRDCGHVKEIRSRGRCDECGKIYSNAKSALSYTKNGKKAKCLECGTVFRATSSSTPYCDKHIGSFAHPDSVSNKSIHGNPGFYYRDKVVSSFGMPIPSDWAVHHIDFDNTNNTGFANFAVMSMKAHTQFHNVMKHFNVIHEQYKIPFTTELKKGYLKEFAEKTGHPVYIFEV